MEPAAAVPRHRGDALPRRRAHRPRHTPLLPLSLGIRARGRGTPAPIAPTEHLVVGGPFRWVRNPGYVAVVSLVVGQALVFGSGAVLAYAAVLAVGFHLFVVLYEEPTLRRQFGEEYEAYCREVPRWFPRRQPSRWQGAKNG
jgi:protein-S-isoprenylcysteine O-methyltransferase Ste14